jgi:acyl-CoA synthetase (AMP-forming)/AMP-acid ligase II
MPFYAPDWVPKLPFDIPDSISVDRFILDENFERHPLGYSRPPFTCGLTGKHYSALEVKERVDFLARGLSKELGVLPNTGSEWDKVIGLFSINTVSISIRTQVVGLAIDFSQIDTLTLAWATHRIGGIQTPANAAYTVQELEHQLRDSGARCLFTCLPLLDLALQAAKTVGIPESRIYLLEVPESVAGKKRDGYKTLDQIIDEGRKLPRLEELNWSKGDGARKTSFLCYSSGTSGLPVGFPYS